MATITHNLPESPGPSVWFWEFLKEELAPYPGRAAVVARMVIAATIVMLITMTFRIPYGAYGALYTLTISRESPERIIALIENSKPKDVFMGTSRVRKIGKP